MLDLVTNKSTLNNTTTPSKAQINTIKTTNTLMKKKLNKYIFLYRIKLDLTINAPIIIVPQSSHSVNALLLDCGTITINTSLKIMDKYYENEEKLSKLDEESINDRCKIPPIIEIQTVCLSNMEVSRIVLKEDLSIFSELSLVSCSDFKLMLNRNTQPLVFRDITEIAVEAFYHDGLHMSLSIADYKFLVEIINNLNEKGVSFDLDPQTANETKEQLLEVQKEEKIKQQDDDLLELYDAPKLNVKMLINSIRLTLYNTDTAMESGKMLRLNDVGFSQMELKMLYFELNIFHQDLQVRDHLGVVFNLDSIILDDTSQMNKSNNIGHPIRIMEKYINKQLKVQKQLLHFEFSNKTLKIKNDDDKDAFALANEKKIILNFNCFRLCVNIDYLFLLYDFFIDGLPKETIDGSKTKSIKDNKVVKNEVVNRPLTIDTSNDLLFCDIMIEKPQFIIYESQYDIKNSNSLIIDGIFHFKVTRLDDSFKIYSNLSELKIMMKSIKNINDKPQKISYLVLSPTAVVLSGSVDDSPQRFNADYDKTEQNFLLDISQVSLNMCPLIMNVSLKMVNSILTSLNNKFSVATPDIVPQMKLPDESLFNSLNFNPNDFWFTKVESNLDNSSSSLSLSEYSMTGSESMQSVSSRTCRTQLTLFTKNIHIKLESAVSEQIPLVGLNLSINGELTNWSTKPQLNIAITLEMASFNEALTVWEPVIEPIEFRPDQFKPYEISIDMVTNMDTANTSQVSQNKSKKQNELSQFQNYVKINRSFHMHSSTPLQFVVTKSFLNILDTVLKTFKLDQNENSDDKNKEKRLSIDSYLDDTESESKKSKYDKSMSFDSSSKLDNIFSDDTNDKEYEYEESLTLNFIVKNELGIEVLLEALSGFKFLSEKVVTTVDDDNIIKNSLVRLDKVELKNKQFKAISLNNNEINAFKASEDEENKEIFQQMQHHLLKFKMNIQTQDLWQPIFVGIGKTSINAYYMSKLKGGAVDEEILLICETETNLEKRKIRLRTAVQIVNELDFKIRVKYPLQPGSVDSVKKTWGEICIDAGKKWCLPIESLLKCQNSEIKISPIIDDNDNNQIEEVFVNWKSLNSNNNGKLLSFNNSIFVQSFVETETITAISDKINVIEPIYNIVLLPTVTLCNYLPFKVEYHISGDNVKQDNAKSVIEPSQMIKLSNAKVDSSILNLKFNYQNATWFCSKQIEFSPSSNTSKIQTDEELQYFEFRSDSHQVINVYCNVIRENKTLLFRLYAPYWVLNQTKLTLEYKLKGTKEDVINVLDKELSDDPLLLKINCDLLTSQQKMLFTRVQTWSDWSDPFVIDAVGNNGTIICKSKNQYYEIGIDIKLSKSGLTKIIKFVPYYLIINNTDFKFDVKEKSNASFFAIEKHTIVPFWPKTHSKKDKNCIAVRLTTQNNDRTNEFSAPFWYDNKHSSVLMFSKPEMKVIVAECVPSEETIRIILRPFNYGMAPVLVVNCLKNVPVMIEQNDEPDDQTFLMPSQYHVKTWKNPIGKRELLWSCGTSIKVVYNSETLQSKVEFEIAKDQKAFCLTFLDGLQKVLLFTDDLNGLNDEVSHFSSLFLIKKFEFKFSIFCLDCWIQANYW
jgi:hypothetical protein